MIITHLCNGELRNWR